MMPFTKTLGIGCEGLASVVRSALRLCCRLACVPLLGSWALSLGFVDCDHLRFFQRRGNLADGVCSFSATPVLFFSFCRS